MAAILIIRVGPAAPKYPQTTKLPLRCFTRDVVTQSWPRRAIKYVFRRQHCYQYGALKTLSLISYAHAQFEGMSSGDMLLNRESSELNQLCGETTES